MRDWKHLLRSGIYEAIIDKTDMEKVNQIEAYASEMLKSTPPIFRNFNPEDLRGIFSMGKFEELDEGYILSDRRKQREFEGYFIADGKLAAMRQGLTIEVYGAGDFIGETFLHSRSFVDCDLVALTSCTIVTFDRESTLLFFRDKPEKLLKIFTINVVEAQQKHICSLYKRISKLLMEKEDFNEI